MPYYKVANLVIDVTSNNKHIQSWLSPFLFMNGESANMNVEILPVAKIPIPEGELVFKEALLWIKKHSDAGGYFGYYETSSHVAVAAIETDADWNNVKIYYRQGIRLLDANICDPEMLCMTFIGIAFRNHLICKNGFVLHASCIAFNGKGIAFSAPSGTGKSTHSKLWEKYKPGAVIINDDMPALRLINGKPMLCGTPWSGSSDIFKNENVALSAIFLLEQSQENTINLVNSGEAVAGLLPRAVLPYHDRTLMDLAIDTFEKIISLIPVYRLKCKPDAEAVELVSQCLR